MAKIKGARKWMLPLCCVAIWGILKTSDARAQVRPFYEDKTIRIVDYGTAGAAAICWPGWWLVTCQNRLPEIRRSLFRICPAPIFVILFCALSGLAVWRFKSALRSC